ncbi:phosphoesterase [Flavivirga aquatica]|uniref:Phosphoesterase n=1 Tax=Flavivirga aquatica TaxID=1849968 RepID=A0A1E5TCX8_9FLAO|nr:metallophosphoesterase [Flavivirga aquatica]OEK09225.1 phosphoesterase [Flavivirga aquatica]
MLRWVIVLIVFGGVDLYAFQAIKTISRGQWLLWLYVIISVLIYGYMTYVFFNYDRSIGPNAATLRAIGLFLLMFLPKVVLFVIMFGEDILRVFIGGYNYLTDNFFSGTSEKYIPTRRLFLSKLALGLSAIPFASLLYGIFKGKYNYKVLKYTLYFEDLPEAFDGFKLTQISDIHSGSFDDKDAIEYAVDLINDQDTDVILFTGDIVNTKAEEMDPWINTFKRIKTPEFGKYSVLGNHDYGEYVSWPSKIEKEANFEAIKNIHNKIDFKLLLNESRYIEKNGQRLALIGVENWGKSFKKAGDLDLATKHISSDDFKILMSHDPSHWEYEVKSHKEHYHLTLSGHTHGLQFGIEIPGFFKWSPVQYVYKQWAGIYKEAGQYINVNRGFGFHAYPGRVGIWPEISVIELKKGSDNA